MQCNARFPATFFSWKKLARERKWRSWKGAGNHYKNELARGGKQMKWVKWVKSCKRLLLSLVHKAPCARISNTPDTNLITLWNTLGTNMRSHVVQTDNISLSYLSRFLFQLRRSLASLDQNQRRRSDSDRRIQRIHILRHRPHHQRRFRRGGQLQ